LGLNYSHLPAWIETNWFFRKLFLIRKLFIIKKAFRHHAQFAEDISIERHFPKKFKGFFVDVGCFHPVKYNNTYKLYKKGWRGVNIDIDSIKIEGFQIVRPSDTNIARAVSNTPGTLDYWSNGFYSLTGSLDESFAAGKPGYIKKTVEADTLTNILSKTKYQGQRIDFLTVDAEGHDYEVLTSLDFEIYQPRLIAVETHKERLEDVQKEQLFQLLDSKGYSMVNWVGLTLLFKHKDEVPLVIR
jgi:hypothetical protein